MHIDAILRYGRSGDRCIMTLPAVEPFTGAAGALAGDWTQLETANLAKDGAGGGVADDDGVNCIAVWTGDSLADDQFAQITLLDDLAYGDTYVALVVRSDTGDEASGTRYWFFAASGYAQLSKLIGGSLTALDSSGVLTFLAGDVIALAVNGTALEVTQNGTPVLSASDGSIASGTVGCGVYLTTGHDLRIDDFLGDDGAPPAGPVAGTHVVSGRGTFALDTACEWLSTSVSGRPGSITSGQAEPANWYHVGMLSWGTANGAMVAYPVTRDLDLVQIPVGMTDLWYEFAGGVTATIVELGAP